MASISTIEALSKDELIVKVMELQHRLSIVEKLAFGPRRERFVADAPANQLALDVTTEAVAGSFSSLYSLSKEWVIFNRQ